MENEKEKIRKLLLKLSNIGQSHFDQKHRTGELDFRAVGLSLVTGTDDALAIAQMAYSGWEDMNYHNACAVLEYIFPELTPLPDGEKANEYLSNLKRVQSEINKRGELTVYTEWNPSTHSYDTAVYKLTVTLEKIT